MSTTMAAVDLGASSGRVVAGVLCDGRVSLVEASRFTNGPVALPTAHGERLYWDVLRLWEAVTQGLRAAAHDVGPLESVGIDTWAVDYGLLDVNGELLGNPASYRCQRTQGIPEQYFASVPVPEMYQRVGVQVQPFNTIFQLLSEVPGRLAMAHNLLLMPDLLAHWMTGRAVAEVTNASTTGLLDPRTRSWRPDMLLSVKNACGKDIDDLLGELVEPGELLGPIRTPDLGLTSAFGSPTAIVAVGSHDTASAVVAVPTQRKDFAYISCGTWSLVGLELERPVLTDEARRANLTNELGVDGTVRFLKNVMGLWVFNEALRTWRDQRHDIAVAEVVRAAATCEPLRTVVDIDDPVFFSTGDMPARIVEAARLTNQPQPRDPGEVARCIFDSLALAYRRAIRAAATVADRDVGVVHMVGGGVQNALLCQLTADATGLPVVAGPVEATAMGNIVVQARAMGAVAGGMPELRDIVRASSDLLEYHPRTDVEATWRDAERRLV